MLNLDERVMDADKNWRKQEEIIIEYKPFILKCASDACKRYVNISDDEWSIALGAFTEALKSYRKTEGSFLTFAKLVIRRRLYDYFDVNSRHSVEIRVDPSIFSGELDDEDNLSDVALQVKNQLVYEPDTGCTDEIQAANEIFAEYGFSFFDLTECSPKAKKTKELSIKAAVFMMKNPILINEMQKSKQLPLKIIENNTHIPRKILERHRKYIIAVVELLSGEYPHLADYLHTIRKELVR